MLLLFSFFCVNFKIKKFQENTFLEGIIKKCFKKNLEKFEKYFDKCVMLIMILNLLVLEVFMRPITMERVEATRQDILNIITSPTLTHEQKLTNLAPFLMQI